MDKNTKKSAAKKPTSSKKSYATVKIKVEKACDITIKFKPL